MNNKPIIEEQTLISAASQGHDEFLDVVLRSLREMIGGEITAEWLARLNANQITLLAYQTLRDEVMDGGFVQFDIIEYDRNDVGVHTYTIKELIGTEDSVLYDGHEETIAVEVTIDDSVEDGVVRVYARVTYSDGTYPNIVFQNWTKPGELSLKKLVDDLLAGHENDEFRFRIRFKQENGLPLTDEMTYRIEP
jgi:pilin isopeptide linkage protein